MTATSVLVIGLVVVTVLIIVCIGFCYNSYHCTDDVERLQDKLVGKQRRLASLTEMMNKLTSFPMYLLEEKLKLEQEVACLTNRYNRLKGKNND